jgi:hypothetical protein
MLALACAALCTRKIQLHVIQNHSLRMHEGNYEMACDASRERESVWLLYSTLSTAS